MGNCESDPSNTVVIFGMSVDDATTQSGISIYPNPVSDKLTISYPSNTQALDFKIFNSIGQIIYSGVLEQELIVETQDFTSGVYYLTIGSGENSIRKKIIKMQ